MAPSSLQVSVMRNSAFFFRGGAGGPRRGEERFWDFIIFISQRCVYCICGGGGGGGGGEEAVLIALRQDGYRVTRAPRSEKAGKTTNNKPWWFLFSYQKRL